MLKLAPFRADPNAAMPDTCAAPVPASPLRQFLVKMF